MADATPKPKPKDYDERIYRKGHPPAPDPQRPDPDRAGPRRHLLRRHQGAPVPATSTSCKAVFDNAANIRKDSPVRIAGVNVGKVQSVEQRRRRRRGHLHRRRRGPADPRGRPGRDPPAHLPRGQLLPRREARAAPARPSSRRRHDPGHPDLDRGPARPDPDHAAGTRPREPPEAAVGLRHRPQLTSPPPPTTRARTPTSRARAPAQAINDSFQYGGARRRATRRSSARPCSGPSPHDLSGLIALEQARSSTPCVSREAQLKDLITNFNITAGAFAAESDNLGETVRLLAPTLEHATPALRNTNATFPYLRAFARDIEPGHRGAAGDDRGLAALAEADRGAARRRTSSGASPTSCG